MRYIASMMAVAGMLALATAADAHPRLQASVPAQNAKLAASPKEIRLNFSEGLIANFSGLELKTGSGKPVATGKPALLAGDNKKLVVPIASPLMPGTYNVKWHAVSVDTHRVSGSYSFKVVK